jgi:hypothetical protein
MRIVDFGTMKNIRGHCVLLNLSETTSVQVKTSESAFALSLDNTYTTTVVIDTRFHASVFTTSASTYCFLE